jgi:hypothetical protein
MNHFKIQNVMRKSFLTIVLLITVSSLFAQDETVLYTSNKWKGGQEKTIYGHTIWKDVNPTSYGYTHISFKDSTTMINEIIKRGKDQMVPQAEINNDLKTLRKLAPGGIINIYIGRLTIGAANTEYFSIVIQDDAGNEVYREALGEDIPETPKGSGYWWNTGSIFIPTVLKTPFHVYVIDRLDEKNPQTHFIVKN